MITSANLDRFL